MVYVVSVVSNPSVLLPVCAYETLEGVIEDYEIPDEQVENFRSTGGSFSSDGRSYEWDCVTLFQKAK